MLYKRIIGITVIKEGWCVQSIGFNQYRPLGRPRFLVENLDRWHVDEIAILCIDRRGLGPDLGLISELSSLGISTPLSYGGGIDSARDAVDVIQCGAERVIVDSLVKQDIDEVSRIRDQLGAQSLIGSIPFVVNEGGKVLHFDYTTRASSILDDKVKSVLSSGDLLSEILAIDVNNEGLGRGFDNTILDYLDSFTKTPIISFGGLSTADHIEKIADNRIVSAVAVGNALNFKEHAVRNLKRELMNKNFRPYHYTNIEDD